MGLRLTAAIPLFASIVSVALTIVLLVSGSSPSTADGNHWLAVRVDKKEKSLLFQFGNMTMCVCV